MAAPAIMAASTWAVDAAGARAAPQVSVARTYCIARFGCSLHGRPRLTVGGSQARQPRARQETTMAKGQKKSNKETRKPKQEKPKPAPGGSFLPKT